MAPKTKFTPGPWSAGGFYVCASTGCVGASIAEAATFERRLADARMMAAAPDMYAAASEIIRLHDTYTGEARDDDAISLAMDDLRAALARANGEG